MQTSGRQQCQPGVNAIQVSGLAHFDLAQPVEAAREIGGCPVRAGEAALWDLYDAIAAPTLLLRGEHSDLLSRETAEAMALRGPKPRCVGFAGVGHAPTLVATDQVAAVRDFLWSA